MFLLTVLSDDRRGDQTNEITLNTIQQGIQTNPACLFQQCWVIFEEEIKPIKFHPTSSNRALKRPSMLVLTMLGDVRRGYQTNQIHPTSSNRVFKRPSMFVLTMLSDVRRGDQTNQIPLNTIHQCVLTDPICSLPQCWVMSEEEIKPIKFI